MGSALGEEVRLDDMSIPFLYESRGKERYLEDERWRELSLEGISSRGTSLSITK